MFFVTSECISDAYGLFFLGCSFAPSLTVLCYKGDKERRAELHRETQTQDFDVLLTTYEVCVYLLGNKRILLRCDRLSKMFCANENMNLSFPAVSQRCFILETVSVS